MLSILIPIYNYKISDLVNQLHNQLVKSEVNFEIICLDDCSSHEISEKNESIQKLSNTFYFISEKNNGIAVTRQALSYKAKYDWILLLDADTEIKSASYISNYLEYIDSGYDAIFGSFAYKDTPPDANSILRWKYGRTYEGINAEKRNKKPYKITIAANLLINKNIYQNFQLDKIGSSYGMDLLFGAKLKQAKTKVLHIDNQVYHLGLESSERYLEKTKLASQTLLGLYKKNDLKEHGNTLLAIYLKSKKTGVNKILYHFYRVFRNSIEKNLLSKNPSMRFLQLYKLLYLCHFDLSKSKKLN